MGANDPQGMANLDPRGMLGRIFVGDHLTLLHTKCVPHGFREEDFLSIFLYILSIFLYKHITPWGVASLDPRGLIGRI